MLDLFNIPTPQTANYQEFYGTGAIRTWVKPRGASMVRFMLIGSGGAGNSQTISAGSGGGGSAAVTSWIGPAMFVPDVLIINVAQGFSTQSGQASNIFYRSSNGINTLLTASGGSASITTTGGTGGVAMPANQFTACGIFTSIAGQAGANGSSTSAGANQTASTTTFLSGGAGGSGAAANTGGAVTPNYGYTILLPTSAGGTVKGADGYFITQPILVGAGGAGGSTSGASGSAGGTGGIGCGGGGSGEDATVGGRGGNGAVFIWAW